MTQSLSRPYGRTQSFVFHRPLFFSLVLSRKFGTISHFWDCHFLQCLSFTLMSPEIFGTATQSYKVRTSNMDFQNKLINRNIAEFKHVFCMLLVTLFNQPYPLTFNSPLKVSSHPQGNSQVDHKSILNWR